MEYNATMNDSREKLYYNCLNLNQKPSIEQLFVPLLIHCIALHLYAFNCRYKIYIYK